MGDLDAVGRDRAEAGAQRRHDPLSHAVEAALEIELVLDHGQIRCVGADPVGLVVDVEAEDEHVVAADDRLDRRGQSHHCRLWLRGLSDGDRDERERQVEVLVADELDAELVVVGRVREFPDSEQLGEQLLVAGLDVGHRQAELVGAPEREVDFRHGSTLRLNRGACAE
ncbi:MAG: hypothetical protein JWM52_709 [Candidatus Saccharibacteria bacterium]|nr:hypothetical protein [Candidatus Saccharibacteria bacterium]